MRYLKAADHRRMAWKNGKGETAEITVFPEDAGLEEFGWRLSMATVTEPGPFSSFADIDRVLAIVDGDGLRLSIDGDSVNVTPKGTAAAFAGDAVVASDLLGGPVTDLNLMTRRGQFRGRIDRVGGSERAEIVPEGAACVILALASCMVAGGGETFALARLDVVMAERWEETMVATGPDGLDLLVVTVLEETAGSR
ncbi:hypothetical protein C8N35_104251 [Breoghania corrubedonensis]|uniref:HutD protein n=1 Tax=Breoghania corrubedonensis TaxID=665038 RepID=A0A2T5VA42_9HYPH|nr:HutD family protein [Breoghania corrubedonensis]PTW60625.1 hypothetical protein C8N35_104251 [Breoghania corrubedonensis]